MPRHPARRALWPALIFFLAGATPAGATDWHAMAAHPERFVGVAVELGSAFCGSGGQEGKEPDLYQCAVGPGLVVVESRRVAFSPAARIKAESCGGLDVWEQNPSCRFSVTLVPTRYRVAPEIDARRRVLLFSAEDLGMR